VHESGGVIVCETDAAQTLPEQAGTFELMRVYRYGKVLAAPLSRPGGISPHLAQKGMDV